MAGPTTAAHGQRARSPAVPPAPTSTGGSPHHAGLDLSAPKAPPPPHAAARRTAGQPYRTSTIPGGLPCLIRLQGLGIRFESLPEVKGIHTPVKILGPVGGITYRPSRRRSASGGGMVCDCRLALALHRAAPFLHQQGVEEVVYSSAYSYRLRPGGRLSQHAMGLALDVHRLRIRGETVSVLTDFVRGQPSCAGKVPPLNQLACALRQAGVFDWVLTPDTDAAHANHFHWDLYCLYRRKFVAQDTPPRPVRD